MRFYLKYIILFAVGLLANEKVLAQLAVTTGSATDISTSTATLNGDVTVDGTNSTNYYFEYGTSPTLTVPLPSTTTPVNTLSNTTASSPVSSLSPATNYFFRLRAEEEFPEDGIADGDIVDFWTYSNVTSTAVASFQRQAATTTSITLEWTAQATDIAGYLIVYTTGGTAPDETDLEQGIAPSALSYTNKVIIADASATSTTITGLSANSQYSFRIIPYNVGSDPATTNYKLTGNSTLSAYTLAVVTSDAIANFDVATKGTTNIELEWTAETTDNDGYLILWATGSTAPDPATEVELGIPPASQAFSNKIVKTGSSSTSQDITTGLVAGTEYSFVIIPYNEGADPSTTNYNVTANSEVSTFTLAEVPSDNASSPVFISSTSTSITIEFAKSDGAIKADGYFITYRSGTSAPGNPGAIDGTDGSSELAEADVDGTFTLFSTFATISATITGLTPKTEYSFRIIAFSSDATNNPSSFNFKTNGITFQNNNNFTLATEPASAVSNFAKTSATETAINFSFDGYTFADNGGFVLYYQSGSTVPDLNALEDGFEPPNQAGLTLDYGLQVTDDATTISTDGNINPGSEYSVIIVPYNYDGSNVETFNYRKSDAVSLSSVWSLSVAASGGAVANAGYTVDNATSNSLDVTYTAVTNADGYLILYSAGNSTFDISDVIDGQSPAQIESALPGGVDLVDNGAALTETIGGLDGDTEYAFYVIPYTYTDDGGPVSETYNYNTASPVLKSGTTLCSTGPSVGSASIGNDAGSLTSTSIKTDLSNVPVDAENLIVARLAADALVAPNDGDTYTANAVFGSGTQTGTGNDVVLAGTGTSVTTTSLSPFTEYAFDYYVYNPNGHCYSFVETIVVTTNCEPATDIVTAASVTNVNTNDVSLSWSITGAGNNVLVVARLTETTSAVAPATGTDYIEDAVYGDGETTGTGNFTVYDGSGTSVNVTNLDALTDYSFDIYEYNPDGFCYNTAPVTVEATTICVSPSTQADFDTFTPGTDQTATTATISWPTVASADRYLILAKEAGTVAFTPSNGSNYEAEDDLDFLLATDKGGGDKVIYAGSHPASAVTITNLLPSTEYNFVIYAYNSLNDCYSFDTPGSLVLTTNTPSANNTLSIVSEAATINSVSNDVSNSFVTALSFDMTDGGVDNANTKMTGFTINAGTGDYFAGNTIHWSDVIASAQFVNTTSNKTIAGSISGTGNTISVSIGPSENNNSTHFGFIGDGETINMELQIKLRDDISGISVDNKNFSFELDPSDITYASNSSTFSVAPGSIITSDPANNEVVVEASKFTFTTQPPASINAGTDMIPVPVFEARDANDNIDLDFSSAFVVSNAGGISMSNAPTTGFTNGVHTFPVNFNYQGSGNGTITITSGAISGSSNTVTVVPTATFAELTTGLNAGTLQSGTTNQAVLGFSIAVLGSSSVDQLVVGIDEPLTSKISNVRLVRSVNNQYDGIASETLITSTITVDNGGGTITISDISEAFSSETKNYFLIADVDNAVNEFTTNPLTFSLGQTGISFTSTVNKGTLNASKTYDFEDIIKPSITTISATPDIISDSEVGSMAIAFTLNFNEEMDPATNPAITFPTIGEVPGSSLVYDAGNSGWSSGNTVFTAVYSLVDNGIDMEDIDVRVSGAVDKSGNVQNIYDESDVFSIDTENPTVGIVLNSSLLTIADETLTLTATFSEAMSTGVTPSFTVNGSSNINTNGAGVWSAGNTVYTQSFIHDLSEEELTNVNITVSAAQDVNGNISVSENSANFAVDTQKPRITEITSSSSNGLYKPGDVINISVAFDEDIAVTGTPFLSLNTGGSGTATFQSVAGNIAIFSYAVGSVGSGQNTLDLDVAGISLDGGTIKDLNENDAELTLPLSPDRLQDNAAIVIDTDPATITNVTATTANGFYNASETINITVTFDEPVTVTGIPVLALNSGGSATYLSGSTTSTLTFEYTVQAGHNAADLNYTATTSLTISGASIKDNAEINATLTLPATGAANSLGGNKNITIDTVDPILSGAPFSPETESLNVSQTFAFTISLNEAVSGAGTNNIRIKELETGDLVTTLDGSSAFLNNTNSTLNFINLDGHIEDSTAYFFEFDAGAIVDRAGNPYAGFSGSSDWNFTSAGPARISTFSTGACVGEEFTIGGKYFTGVTQIVTGNNGDSTYYNIAGSDFDILDDENISFNVKIETYSGKIVLKKNVGQSGNTREFISISSDDIIVGPSSAQFEIVNNEFVCDVSTGGSQDKAELRINVVGGSGVFKIVYNNGVEDVEIAEYTNGSDFLVNPPQVGINEYTLVSVTDTDPNLLTCSAPNLGTSVNVEEFERAVVEAGGGSTDPELNIGLIQICAADTEIVDFSNPTIVGTVASITGSETSGTWTIVGGNASSGGFNASKTLKTTTNIQPTYYISLDDAIRGYVILQLTSDDPGGNNPCTAASDRVVIRFVNSLQANPAESSVSICKTFENTEELAITQLDAVLADGTTDIEWSRDDLYSEEDGSYDNTWGFADTEDAGTFTLTTTNPEAFYKASPMELANNFARLQLLATDGFCGVAGDPVNMEITINDVPAPVKSTLANVNPQDVCSGAENIIFKMNSSSSNAKFIWELSNSGVGSVTESDISSISSPTVEDGIYLSTIEIDFREVSEFTSDTLVVREIRNGCISEPDTFFISISPTPQAEILTGPSASINNTTTKLLLTGQGGFVSSLEVGGVFEGKGVFQGSNGDFFLNTTELLPTDITNPEDNYTLTYTYTTELGCSASTSIEYDVFNADNIFPELLAQYCELDTLIEITVNNIILPDDFIVTDIFGPGITNFEVEEIRTDTSYNIYKALFNPKAALDLGENLTLTNVSIGYATRDTINDITNEEAGLQGVTVYALPETSPTGLSSSYCATDGDAQLSKGISNPNSEFSYSIITEGLPHNLLQLNPGNGNYVFSPSVLYDSLFDNNINSVEIELLYTYKDLNGCTNYQTLSTVVNRQPAQPTFDNTNFCILNGVIAEAVVNNPTASSGEVLWFANENLVGEPLASGNSYIPSATVVQNNTTELFVVRSAENCISEVTTITFRRQTDPSFSWDKSVNNEEGITFTGVNTQADISFVNWTIKRKDNATILVDSTIESSNLTFNQDFNIYGAGVYEVTFEIESQFGCVTSKTNDVTVLLEAPKATTYIYDFNETNNNWITSGENSSWELAEPEIGFDNESAFWVTNATGNYNPNEDSYVYSPEIDLTDVDKPVVSFDLWLNTVSSDGLVIEYSTDEFKVEDAEKTWTKLGKEGSGLNWYNTNNLSSIAFFEGWSGIFNLDNSSIKLNSKHILDPVLKDNESNKVIFRFHFKSINSSPTDGVAFDNFHIESLNRTLLVEYFGDFATPDVDNAEMESLNKQFEESQNMAWINYRVNETDPLYGEVASAISTRAFYYSAFEAENNFALDGVYSSQARFSDSRSDFDRRALIPSIFGLALNVAEENGSLKITADVSLIDDNTIPDNMRLMVAVLNREVDNKYFNVLQAFLPNAQGVPIINTGSYEFTYNPTTELGASKLMVVAFLQKIDDDGDKMIYQSAFNNDVPDLNFSITAINESVLNRVRLFPNPADDKVTINVGFHTNDLRIRLIDIAGKLVEEFSLKSTEVSKEIETSYLRAGMYTLMISDQQGNNKAMKVAIRH
ncbi:fibronectin type III domain-containing protein [Marivirga sp. S37H4]|uniref:Fibronectin type III domain-containing protein n=1 Tax=Marivirga aurantiaca TaxID=2802615 RepID=A0A934X283_9BACT|nr:fibronectin type III domain-containing protein [Marivirga aurantiaca]MBK6267126.1 fibronectin type III domain-containing protein [Marivirga aurantiaca]